MNKRSTVPATCQHCGEVFQARCDSVAVGKGRFCSRECSGHARFTGKDIVARFWEKVRRTDGCWCWTGALNTDGYGNFTTEHRTSIRAHRFAWQLTNGPIPAGLHVLHNCDHPSCVRPDHLFLGTRHDNMRDMASKGRQWSQRDPERFASLMKANPNRPRLGEQNKSARLTAQDVIWIRERYSLGGTSICALARARGVSEGCIRLVVRRKTWTHV